MALDKVAETQHTTSLSITELREYLDDCENRSLSMVKLSCFLNKDGSLKSINITGFNE